MNKFIAKSASITYKFTCLTMLSLLLYALLRPIFRTLMVDIIGLPSNAIQQSEPLTMVVFVLIIAVLFPIGYLLIRRYESESMYIDIENTIEKYPGKGSDEIIKFYENIIIHQLPKSPSTFFHIRNKYPRPVYTLTGGWLAGKTVAAGLLVKHMREDEAEGRIIGSEVYHDTFSFGNIDESILNIFKTLSIKTGIIEFEKLASISSPGLDMNFNLGPVSFKKSFETNHSANKLRANIYKKLHRSNKLHVVVIDDIDRLLPNEQAQWMRVIELLGQFYGSLILIVPINLRQVSVGLKSINIPSSYLDKILPIENRLGIGVDIEYIRKKFNVRKIYEKKLYAKYCMSLAIRIMIKEMENNSDMQADHWRTYAKTGYFSKLASIFAASLNINGSMGRDNSLDRITWSWPEALHSSQTFKSFTDTHLGKLLNATYLINDHNEIKPNAIYIKYASTLRSIFADQSLQIRHRDRSGEVFSPDMEVYDFWKDIAWKIVSGIDSDHALSNYFNYELIDKELEQLLNMDSQKVVDQLVTFVKEAA